MLPLPRWQVNRPQDAGSARFAKSVFRLGGGKKVLDSREMEGALAGLLKFLVQLAAGVAVLHKLQPYGLALF